MSLTSWLWHGSDEMVMSQAWLDNHARLRAYEGWTRRQLQQGRVVADVDEMRRRAFWEAVAAKRAQMPAPLKFIRGSR